MHPTKESSDPSLDRTVSTDARRPVDEGEGGENFILKPFQESAAKLQALALGPGKTDSIATSLVAPSSSESDPPAVSITRSMVPPTGTPVLETRNSNRGPLPPSSDCMVDMTQSGPPLPGRTRLVLRFDKDSNLSDNWNPVVPPFVPLYEDADEGENLIPEVESEIRN